jgi:hypothetical protein
MLLQRSGEECLKMGCSMHATAQALVRAATLAQDRSASGAILRKALFLRFYGQEFDTAARNRILKALEKNPSGDPNSRHNRNGLGILSQKLI